MNAPAFSMVNLPVPVQIVPMISRSFPGVAGFRRAFGVAWIFGAALATADVAPSADPPVPPVAAPRVPSFRHEVEPVLTRLGCNQGACHGKLAGQNGFKLSLRAYAPELDHAWITRDVQGRRINPAHPANSLLVTKAVGSTPHEGGVRMTPGDRYHQLLVDWIAARAPGPKAPGEEPEPVALELTPAEERLTLGQAVQLKAQARWSDGSVRDVTWLTQFFSNEETTASVTPTGQVVATRFGATSIRAHFDGLVSVARMVIPSTNAVESWKYARRQNPLDDAVFAQLESLHLPPSPRCDDVTFLRRAMLDTLGTLPTPAEVSAYLADSRPERRKRLVESLFLRPEFVDYWTLQLADLLQNRKERDHDVRGTKGVRAFHAWLRSQVSANRPWDALVRDLLTAHGDVGASPAVGYFVTLYGEKTPAESEITDAVAQAFLGTRIGCARCHNHPLERFTQDDFYQFAAFFGKTALDRQELGAGRTSLALESREGRDRRHRMEEARSKMDESQARLLKAGQGADASAVRREFADRQREFAERKQEWVSLRDKDPVAWQPRTHRELLARPLDRMPLSFRPDADARAVLADWITSPTNAAFSGAMVNRLWKHFFSVGLVEPVDDLRASNPPTNPQAWEWLSREFVASGYDLRQVMRLILNSRTYQLASSTVAGNAAEHKFFSHYYARRLPAEVLQDALALATGVPDRYEGHPVGLRAIQLPEPNVGNYFLSLFGRSDRVTACACERSGEVTLPQLLHLQNGEATSKKLQDDHGRLRQLIRSELEPRQKLEQLYLARLSRRPTADELTRVAAVLLQAKDDEVLPDLFWALLNTKEFAFNH